MILIWDSRNSFTKNMHYPANARCKVHFLLGVVSWDDTFSWFPSNSKRLLQKNRSFQNVPTIVVKTYLPGSPSDLNTGNRIEGATSCPSWCRQFRPLFHFLCSNLKANPVHFYNKRRYVLKRTIFCNRPLYLHFVQIDKSRIYPHTSWDQNSHSELPISGLEPFFKPFFSYLWIEIFFIGWLDFWLESSRNSSQTEKSTGSVR